MSRYSKPTVFIQNSAKEKNIDEDEIKDFIHHTEQNNCNGVFLSQHSGITNKNNYQIEIHAGNIIVYVHSVDYSSDKIKIAIDIIDNLALKLKLLENTNEDEYSVSKEDMEDIIEEYRNFGSQKSQMIDTIKSVTKQLIDKMEENLEFVNSIGSESFRSIFLFIKQ
jgi:dissimilatory sulfite reductase (desulfoviridin) alpha/beta subunit